MCRQIRAITAFVNQIQNVQEEWDVFKTIVKNKCAQKVKIALWTNFAFMKDAHEK